MAVILRSFSLIDTSISEKHTGSVYLTEELTLLIYIICV
jgi:hypothetical protein